VILQTKTGKAGIYQVETTDIMSLVGHADQLDRVWSLGGLG
jgi:hypothetical protein